MKRRSFVKKTVLGAVGLSTIPNLFGCIERNKENKLFLLRYDTEWWGDWSEMDGFIEKVIEVHTSLEIPATFFCKGETLDLNKKIFSQFYNEVRHNPLFDFQDHSYSHIGLGYSKGKSIETLKADYENSFAIHEKIFNKRPTGISICGTSDDGSSLDGFDANDKSKAELDMVAGLGVKMINSFLTGIDGSKMFIDYSSLGHPDIMGFPSSLSDTAWMWRREFGDPVEYILNQIKIKSKNNEHFPLMFHDWVCWQHAPDRELTHLKKFVDLARKEDYEMVSHSECYERKYLWKS